MIQSLTQCQVSTQAVAEHDLYQPELPIQGEVVERANGFTMDSVHALNMDIVMIDAKDRIQLTQTVVNFIDHRI